MRTQTLGKSSLSATRLSYGCMRISGTWDPAAFTPDLERQGLAALRAAYEAGYTLFDHADIYGRGLCETIHGKLLKESPDLRKRTVLVSKCGIRWQGDPDPSAPHRWDFSARHIEWSCEQTLKRLGVEALDLYLLHRPDFLADPAEIAGAFSRLKQAGKVKEFGVSNFRPSLLAALQSACPMPLVVNQVPIHAAKLDAFEDGTLDQCLEKTVTPMAYSPLAGGLLGEGGKPDPKDPRHRVLMDLCETLDDLATERGTTRMIVALAWLLKHPAGIVPVLGSAQPARIKEAAQADSLELSREEWYRVLLAARGEGLP